MNILVLFQKLKTLLLILILNFVHFSAFQVNAQNTPPAYDKIILKDYSILEVKIIKLTDQEVEYQMPDENIVRAKKTIEIAKIIFANGKSQSFTETVDAEKNNNGISNQNTTPASPQIKPNTIAVLPVPFVNSESQATSSEMAKFAQNDIYSNLMKNASGIQPLQVQDLRTTNSLLKKAGIDYSNIDEVTIEDLQNILGVDHVIAAKVSYVMTTSITATSSENTKITSKDKKTEVDDFSITSSGENKKYDFTVFLDIYKNSSKIYSKNRQPFFKEKDSWIDSIQYLIKRSPIFSRG